MPTATDWQNKLNKNKKVLEYGLMNPESGATRPEPGLGSPTFPPGGVLQRGVEERHAVLVDSAVPNPAKVVDSAVPNPL